MSERVTVSEAIRRVAALRQGALVAIDGLPVSGKSTLADRIVRGLGFAAIFLDDFVLPESQWPTARVPALPFPYFRWEEFTGAVWSLANTGRASFRGFDWSTMSAETKPRIVENHRGVVVEGVSSLHPDLNQL